MFFANFPADASRLSSDLSRDCVTFGLGHCGTLKVIFTITAEKGGVGVCWDIRRNYCAVGRLSVTFMTLKEVPEECPTFYFHYPAISCFFAFLFFLNSSLVFFLAKQPENQSRVAQFTAASRSEAELSRSNSLGVRSRNPRHQTVHAWQKGNEEKHKKNNFTTTRV